MKKRPEELDAKVYKRLTGCGKLYITVGFHEEKVFELFAKLGKAGGCASAQTEAIGRLVSYEARSGQNLEGIVRQLKGIQCHEAREDTSKSCADAIASVLEAAMEHERKEEEPEARPETAEEQAAEEVMKEAD